MRCFVLGLLLSLSAAAAEPLRLVTVLEAGSPASTIQAQFIADLFQRIDVPYSLSHRPPRRAELEFKNHQFDGDAARSVTFAENYPAAIRVNPAFFSQPIYAITRGRVIKQWSDLYRSKVAYRRGIVSIENQLRPHAQLNPADSISACIRMVQAAAQRRIQARPARVKAERICLFQYPHLASPYSARFGKKAQPGHHPNAKRWLALPLSGAIFSPQ
jgi:hypothetical protein